MNRNDDIDRTVPPDENYYSGEYNSRNNLDRDIIDNQKPNYQQPQMNEPGFNPADMYNTDSFGNENPAPARNYQNNLNNQKKDRPANPPKKKGKKKKPKAVQIILAVILALAVGITALAMPILSKITYDDKKANEYVNESDLKSSSSVTNILLLGVDARADEESNTSRSDSMMVVSLDSKNH